MQNKFIYFILIVILGVGGFLFYREQAEEWEEEQDVDAEVVVGMPVPGAEGRGVEETIVSFEKFPMSEVAKHNTRTDCWAVINGSVYGLTEWITKHPGGADKIIALCGKDGSSAFNGQHGEYEKAKETLVGFKIGELAQ